MLRLNKANKKKLKKIPSVIIVYNMITKSSTSNV